MGDLLDQFDKACDLEKQGKLPKMKFDSLNRPIKILKDIPFSEPKKNDSLREPGEDG